MITEYGYQHGILKTVEYSGEPGESTTADIVYSYDIFGRVRTVTQGDINTHTYSYKDDLHDDDDDSETDDVPYGTGFGLHSETVNYGTGAPARTIIRHEDDIQRPSGWQLKDVGTVEHAVAYGYDTAGRARHVHPAYPLPGSPDYTYHYEDDSFHLLSSVVGPAHTVFNVWDSTRDVLDTKFNTASVVSNTLLSSFHYTVNDIGQRTAVAPAPVPDSIPAEFPAYEIAWTWGYNARGEVVSADHGSDTEANAEDRFYRFDAIGNRDYIRNGVHADSGGTQVNYTANELNQYTGNDQNFIHDLDGNLEEGAMRYDALSDKDGTSYTATLRWDAENRLVGILDDETVMAAYRYDYLGRRISRTAGGTTTWYFYDGWNPIAEYAGTTHSKSYTWGIDFSGTMQGAGGVGGLLAARHESATGKPSFYPAYDGNGNVTEYLDKDGEVEVRFEYDPFGRLVVSTDANGAFPIRFSTKMLEDKTGLYYYGYRYYDPVTGRWPSRDPIAERGGLNLYAFVANDGVNGLDLYGLVKNCCCVENVTIDPKSIKHKEDSDEKPLLNHYEGHQFTLDIQLKHKLVTDDTDKCACILEWWEWSSDPLGFGKKQAKNWQDGAADDPNISTLSPWRDKTGYQNNVSITDTPSIKSFAKHRFGKTRILYILIRVTSGASCECQQKSKEVRVYQKLTLKDNGHGFGVVDDDKSELKTVDNGFGIDEHGGWPK